MKPHVKIVAHEGLILMWPQQQKRSGNIWVPTSTKLETIGCVISNTRENLSVSEEALELMRAAMKHNGPDAIGDMDWWEYKGERGRGYAFAWFGAIYRVVDPNNCMNARDFDVHPDECTIIPNELPPDAWDAAKMGTEGRWKDPYCI